MADIYCKYISVKRVLYSVLLFMLIFFSAGEAGSVKVKGTGTDKDSAVRDAMRVAVERVIGTYVDSKTLVEQAKVVEDTILAKSQGFVTDVQILSEGKAKDGYWVEAKVEVNENPNSALRNQLQMVMMLGNPRIGVIIIRKDKSPNSMNGGGNREFDDQVELEINEKLRNLGFNHIVDANIVAKLRNSPILNNILNGANGGGFGDGDMGMAGGLGMDILILGNSTVDSNFIKLMNIQNNKGNEGNFNSDETPLVKGTAVVTGKVIVLSTGEIKHSFKSMAYGVDTVNSAAQMKASAKAATLVAAEVEKALRTKAAKLVDGKQIAAIVPDQEVLDKLVGKLKRMKGMDDVKVRMFSAGRAVIDLDTSLTLMDIFRNLRDNSGLFVRNEGIEGDVINICVEQG